MKKVLKTILVLALAALCLTAVAAAADAPASGICDVTVEAAFSGKVALTAQKADGTAVSTTTPSGEKAVYADAVKVQLTYTGTNLDAAAQYLVVVLTDNQTVPTENNVGYIDQTSGTVTFTIYPESLVNDKTYSIYISTSSATDSNFTSGLTKVGSFSYYAPYTRGDVNEDKKINTADAMQCFNHFVHNITLTGNRFLAADVAAPTGTVNTADGMRILNYFVHNITEL